jgi:hypothetical protein
VSAAIRKASLGLFCVLALVTAGCRFVVLGPPGVAVVPGPGGEFYVQQAPPALVAEAPPPMPGPGYIWCPGYWGWHHNRHDWVRGHWAVPPRRAAVWVPHHWEHGHHGWRLAPGHWR